MLTDQGGECWTGCGFVATINSRGFDNLQVDHWHHSGCEKRSSCGECVRGLACAVCNKVLGFADDDSKLLGILSLALKRCGISMYGFAA
jgi:hypothetical protein